MIKALLLLMIILPFIAVAQNNNAPSSYDPHDIKITGYLQTQFQKAQSAGIASFSGGDFSANSDNRFMIRRGRLKIDRVDKYTSIVFQLDATQDGLQLMDAFIQLKEPKYKALLFTAGLFNKPFGYSIVYSSGYRDFPERARVFQTLMPRERDLGALIHYNPQKVAKFLTLEIAVVNGSGKNAKDYDSKKDFIGNLGFRFDSLANKKLHLGFGGSIYKGSVRSNTKTYFTSTNNGYAANTSEGFVGKNIERNYYGGNLQLQYDSYFGTTTLKGEYVTGKQPGVASAGLDKLIGPYASQSFGTQPLDNLYERNFSGYYLWFTQQIAKTKLTALIAYDVYDPNTDTAGKSIGVEGNFTNSADVKYSTIGYGLAYQLNQRLKFTVYNEHIKNETTSLKNYSNDIRDDVFTTRMQYRW
nr:porin [Pedobacter sp. ASV2]